MFIPTEQTPNPSSIKFFPSNQISPDQPIHFSKKEDAAGVSSLALKLLDIEDVYSVFFGSDFITITKTESANWLTVKPEVLMIMMDHFVSGFLALDGIVKNHDVDYNSRSDIEMQIIELIDTRIRPSVAMDGGDIVYRGFKEGVVQLELRGACSNCPSSSITLKNGIESLLKLYIAEVKSVEEVYN
ncbi:MAG: NifU family protein [Rickettsiaceae bacterium]|nr:MAG: NifU family protein [Rickettsiaceae bacterium]